MKCLNIQLHPELCSDDVENHVANLTAIANASARETKVSVDRDDDDGPYINVNVYTDDIVTLWSAVSLVITSTPSLAAAAIVCCEGDNGWDDYLLLHHFDGEEDINRLL
jgi:hypothetical protein